MTQAKQSKTNAVSSPVLKEFTGTDSVAKSNFTLPKGTTPVIVYSHCNLRDLRDAPPQKV